MLAVSSNVRLLSPVAVDGNLKWDLRRKEIEREWAGVSTNANDFHCPTWERWNVTSALVAHEGSRVDGMEVIEKRIVASGGKLKKGVDDEAPGIGMGRMIGEEERLKGRDSLTFPWLCWDHLVRNVDSLQKKGQQHRMCC